MTKPVRPYNEYNIFFQLEREYILQVLLSVEPTYEPSDIFHPDNDSHYKGPCLPSRYDGLVLPNDWYVPGKTRRRKRRHRKSHGAIGFQELSLKIADAWSHVDDETRMFCAYLCDIGMMEYNMAVIKYKQIEDRGISKEASKVKASSKSIVKKKRQTTEDIKNETEHSPAFSKNRLEKGKGTLPPIFEFANKPQAQVPNQGEFSSREILDLLKSVFVIKLDLYTSCFLKKIEESTSNQGSNIKQTILVTPSMIDATASSFISSCTCVATSPNESDSFVDMEDEEIMKLWESTSPVVYEIVPRTDTVPSESFVSHHLDIDPFFMPNKALINRHPVYSVNNIL